MASFKIDENLPVEAADLLRSAGHDAMTVLEQRLSGEPDPRISAVCMAEGRAIVTLDLDFSDIRNYPPSEYAGLIVLRLVSQDLPSVLKVLTRLLPLFEQEPVVGKLWIVDESRIRIRE
jgi:predicted nuclease of predicted toxin-antitoxin system